MTYKQIMEALDQLETSCMRANEARKDVDLIVALRILHGLVEERAREESEKAKGGLNEAGRNLRGSQDAKS